MAGRLQVLQQLSGHTQHVFDKVSQQAVLRFSGVAKEWVKFIVKFGLSSDGLVPLPEQEVAHSTGDVGRDVHLTRACLWIIRFLQESGSSAVVNR